MGPCQPGIAPASELRWDRKPRASSGSVPQPRPPMAETSGSVCSHVSGDSPLLLTQERGTSSAEPFCPPAPHSQTRDNQELGRGGVSEGLSLPQGSQAREGGPHPNSQSWLQNEQWLQAQEGQRGRRHEALLGLSHGLGSVSGLDPCLVQT